MTSFADLGGIPEEETKSGGFADLGGIPESAPDPFDAWAAVNKVRADDPTYNYRAAFANNEKPDENGHWSDKYKTPAHPTFSTESVVGNGKVGGQWVAGRQRNTWEFRASQANLEHQTPEQLMDYFDRVEPGNTLVLPDGRRYTSGDAGPRPVGDEEYQVKADKFVADAFIRAQRGDPTHELEASELADITGADRDVIKTKIDDVRAYAKLAQENPRRWRTEHPDLYEMMLLHPTVGPSVIKERTVFERLAKGQALDAYADEHPWETMLGALDSGDPSSVTVKRQVPTEMADMSHLSINEIAGEEFNRAKDNNIESKAAYARAQLEFANYDSPQARAMREAYSDRRNAAGLTPYYGEGRLRKTVAQAAGAIGGQIDSIGSLAGGAVTGLVAGRFVGAQAGQKIGMMTTRILGATTSYVTEGGGFYNETADMVDTEGRPIDPKLRFAGMHLYGALAAAVEVATLGREGARIAGLNAKRMVRSMMTDSTKAGALLNLAKTIAKNGADEGVEGGTQQAMSVAIKWLATSLSPGDFGKFDLAAAEAEVMTSAGQEALGGALGISLVGGVANTAQALMTIDESVKAGRELAALHEVAKGQAAQAAPRSVAAWIASRPREDGRKVTHVYVDPVKIVDIARAGNTDAREIATQLMGDEGPRRLQEALDRAGDAPGTRATLEVPMAEYLEKWGAKPIAEQLLGDMTTSPNHMTENETKRLFQSGAGTDLNADAESLAGGEVSDSEAVTEQEALLNDSREDQLVAAGQSRRVARQAVMVEHAAARGIARVVSQMTGRPVGEIVPQILARTAVRGEGADPKAKPIVRTTVAGPRKKAPTFKTSDEAYKAIVDMPDITGVADLAYQNWKNGKRRDAKPKPFEGGTFDAINEMLELKGDKRVTGTREAFDKLFHRARGTFAARAQEAVSTLSAVPGLESLRIPDEYLQAPEDTRTAADVEDTSFEFGANVGDPVTESLLQSVVRLFQTAWHGTPHRGIDKFSLKHLGSGEGAQVYGWGLYFASDKGVAEWYRTKLAPERPTVLVDGIEVTKANLSRAQLDTPDGRARHSLHRSAIDLADLSQKPPTLAEVIANAREEYLAREANYGEGTTDGKIMRSVVDAIDALVASGRVDMKLSPPGQLHKVEVPDGHTLLDYDKAIAEQSPEVMTKLRAAGIIRDSQHAGIVNVGNDYNEPLSDRKSGRALYRLLSSQLGSDEAASRALLVAGVPGLQFLDGNSRSAGKGSHNFVIWDEDAIQQLEVLYQTEGGDKRGWVDIIRKGTKRTFNIFLTKNADASTFLHESAHVMFETYEDIVKDPRAPERIRRDWASLRKWVGAADGAELTEAQKEKMARGFEAYIREGKAPSSALAEAFESFRLWLMQVYQTIAKLNVEINDEVRGVFDRMLATDREIEQARAAAGLATKVAATPEEAGVPPEEFDAYLAADARNRSAIVMRTQRMISEGRERALKAFKTEEHRKLVEKAGEAYDALPERRAWRYLTMGEIEMSDGSLDRNTGRGRLNRDELERFVGQKPEVGQEGRATWAINYQLLKSLKTRSVKSGGESVVDIAQMFDMSAADMLQRIAHLPDRATYAKEQADRMMRELHPEIDGEIANIQEAIQKLLHADGYDEPEREWGRMKAFTSDQMSLEALQRAAKIQIDNQLVGRIDPGVVLNRERSLATAATQAFAKKEYDKAMALQHRRMLHKYMWKELVEARDMRESGVDLMSEMVGDPSRKRLGLAGVEHRDVVDTLLEKIGAVNPRPQNEPRADMGRLMGKMALDGNSVSFDPIFISELMANPRPWKELSIGEFRDVMDALRNIRAAARNNNTRLKDGQREDIDELINRMVEKAKQKISKTYLVSSGEGAESELQKFKRLRQSYDGVLLRPETMLEFLGWDEGDTDVLHPLQQAKHKATDLMRETAAPIAKLFDKIPGKIRARLMENIDGRALFPNHPTKPGAPTKRYQLLMMALNAGNQSNLDRLLGGRKITQAELNAALSLLTEAELQWVQTVLDQIETLWPHLKEIEERDSGLPLEKIQAKAFTVNTSDGKTIDMRGGYFPAVYDNRYGVGKGLGWKVELQSASDALDMNLGKYPTTNKSASKKRANKYEDIISLEPVSIQSHIVRVTHDIAYREVIRSSARIFLDQRIKDVLVDKLGIERAKMFEPWLRDIGRLEAAQLDDHGGIVAKIINRIKGNLPVAVLGHALDNYLGDTTGLITAAIGSGLDKGHYGSGLVDYASHPFESRKMALEKSGELRSRSDETYQGFARRMKSIALGPVRRKEAWIRDHAFYFAEQLEKAIVTPVWLGAYRQGLAENRGEAKAVEFADDLVRRSFPAKGVVDKSALQRDKGVLGSMLAFVGYANWVYNQNRRIWHPVFNAQGTKARALAATSALFQHAAMALVIGPMAELLVGHGPEKKDGEDAYQRWVRWSTRKLLLAHLMPLPLVGGLVEHFAMGEKVSVRTSPAVSVVESMSKAIGKATKENAEPIDIALGILTAYGYAKGLPTVRPTRILDYLLGRDDYDNTGGIASGILYGERRSGQPDNPIKMIDRALE